MSIEQIGCCGAYCGKCSAFMQNACLGCKIGYSSGERNIKKAKCEIKICCVKRSNDACGVCDKLSECSVIAKFHEQNGYKYGKYKLATEYIRDNGCDKFVEIADTWSKAYGKFE